MNSFNHYAYGAVGDWIYRVVAGIDTDPDRPGYKHVLIQPQPGGGLTRVSASLETMYGTVSSSWSLDGDRFRLQVEIPANTSATIRIPGTSTSEIAGPGIIGVREERDAIVVEAGSGKYDFETTWNKPPLNSLSERERAEGWKLLFDGETFSGWRGLGREGIPESHWVIEEGNIRKVASGAVPTAADGQPLEGGDIMTVDTYENFELAWEWKVAPGANSGVKYNVSEEMSQASPPQYAALGFEYQILDDEKHPDAKNGPNRTAAALYDLAAPSQHKLLNPVGDYNHSRIIFHGKHGEHWLNGEKAVEFDLDSDAFKVWLEASKYQPIPEFAEKRKGHIVLQDHGDDVCFRNIRIRELPPDGSQK
jgi:hypothetical protein